MIDSDTLSYVKYVGMMVNKIANRRYNVRIKT